ncbi:MAG: Cupin domain [Chloroflexi bacterium]|nr:Cupin domain [Chloroflexota bacterium]
MHERSGIMVKAILATVRTALLAAGILLAASALPSVGAESALAPQAQVTRNTLIESAVDLGGGTYQLVLAELTFEPGAETPLHQHPGPSVGYVETGRIGVTVPSEGVTNSFSAGSAINHPWDTPHIFRNSGDQAFKMLSFELIPIALQPSGE